MQVGVHHKGLQVTLGLISGDRLTGRFQRFSPLSHHLQLEVEGEEDSQQLDSSEVAYVGFHPRPEGESQPPDLSALQAIKVHTVGNECFPVLIPSFTHPSGFFGFVEDEKLPFERMFFYHHGIRTKEHSQPLGQVLVEEDLASGEAVNKALENQKSERTKPIGSILVEQERVQMQEVDAALKQQKRKRKPLGELLMESGLIGRDDLDKALAEQVKRRGKKLGDILVSLGAITEEALIAALAKKFNLPFVNLDEHPIEPDAIMEIDKDLVTKHHVLPISADDENITVAISDPLANEAYDVIRFQTTKHIHEVLVTPSQLKSYLEQLLGSETDEKEEVLWIQPLGEEGEETETETEAELVLEAAEAPPVVRLVNKIIIGALRKGASDIHVLPQATKLQVAYRVDGELRNAMTLGRWVHRRAVSRIKIISGMDISERRLPQDGKLMVRHNNQQIEFRISCIPGTHGESVVMRILNKDMTIDMGTLGLHEQDSRRLSQLLRKPFGLILVTGPTGSGKSTTLFSLLKSIIHLPVHIITIEDPVESDIPGANQIQINTKVGLDFARALRNVLRHDPDVVMVGEMRDRETAEIGVQAALTGHLMFSTLHTNTAVDTVVRLTDIGIPAYLLAPALLAIISQSLIKRLCPECRKPVANDDEAFSILSDMGHEQPQQLFEAGGCEHCDDSGYSGRIMVYELLEISDEVRQAIHDGKVGQELQAVAEKAGMIPKARQVLEYAGQGLIGRDDLIRYLL